jgi:hypothetical protein
MKAHQLFLYALTITLGAIVFGQCERQKLNHESFTVHPNHNEQFTIRCSYRSMEVWWGEDFIFESQDTDKIVSFVLVGMENGIGGMVTKDSCYLFEKDSLKMSVLMKDMLNGLDCTSNRLTVY